MASKSSKVRKPQPARKSHAKKRVAPARRKRSIADVPATTKLAALIALLSTPAGATLEQMTSLTGWQAHSVRGAMSGMIKKKLGHSIVSKKAGDVRVYRIGAKS